MGDKDTSGGRDSLQEPCWLESLRWGAIVQSTMNKKLRVR